MNRVLQCIDLLFTAGMMQILMMSGVIVMTLCEVLLTTDFVIDFQFSDLLVFSLGSLSLFQKNFTT